MKASRPRRPAEAAVGRRLGGAARRGRDLCLEIGGVDVRVLARSPGVSGLADDAVVRGRSRSDHRRLRAAACTVGDLVDDRRGRRAARARQGGRPVHQEDVASGGRHQERRVRRIRGGRAVVGAARDQIPAMARDRRRRQREGAVGRPRRGLVLDGQAAQRDRGRRRVVEPDEPSSAAPAVSRGLHPGDHEVRDRRRTASPGAP